MDRLIISSRINPELENITNELFLNSTLNIDQHKRDMPISDEEKLNSALIFYGIPSDNYGNPIYIQQIPRDYSPEKESEPDFQNQAAKTLSIKPKSSMGGILGYTYLGHKKMTLRDDLIDPIREMVLVHEARHTPDEYETRVLTDWVLSNARPKYRR